jgi:hypothetical protein
MHKPTDKEKQRYARYAAERIGVTARTIRKARQGHNAAIDRVIKATIGNNVTALDVINGRF